MTTTRREMRDELRIPATIDPDVREGFRNTLPMYLRMGRTPEDFATEVLVRPLTRGQHASRAPRRATIEAEVAALREVYPDLIAVPAQPLPLVRFSQAGVASVRGGVA